VGLDRFPDQRSIANITYDKLGCATARPVRGFTVAGRQIVIDYDPVTGFPERFDRVAADVAGATGDENRAHCRPIE
jgi:hypothetical protein